MVDVDAALGEQLLHIPERQAEPQVPAHRQHDHLGWEAETDERRITQNLKISLPSQPHGAEACRSTRPRSTQL
jgi:hypothetical protein